jgi:hypothetical protein
MRRLPTLSLAAVLLAASPAAAGDLRSGPQVGAGNDRDGFFPQFVTGPVTGKRLCPV